MFAWSRIFVLVSLSLPYLNLSNFSNLYNNIPNSIINSRIFQDEADRCDTDLHAIMQTQNNKNTLNFSHLTSIGSWVLYHTLRVSITCFIFSDTFFHLVLTGHDSICNEWILLRTLQSSWISLRLLVSFFLFNCFTFFRLFIYSSCLSFCLFFSGFHSGNIVWKISNTFIPFLLNQIFFVTHLNS